MFNLLNVPIPSFLRNKHHKTIFRLFLLVSVLTLCNLSIIYGRAGGAGGSEDDGSSSSYESSSHEDANESNNDYGSSSNDNRTNDGISVDSNSKYGFIVYVLIMGIPIAIILLIKAHDDRLNSIAIKNLNIISNMGNQRKKKILQLLAENSCYNAELFDDKVRTAFLSIQEAWSKKDLSAVRWFISDGIYQRFTTQFRMMDELKQTNVVSGESISSITIRDVRVENGYMIIDVRISAALQDDFICALDHSMDDSAYTKFVEYWSFICKQGVSIKDIYSTSKCPGCDAPLPPDIGEVSQCSYCKVIVNSGEFDWVLSEITQQDDYAISDIAEKQSKAVKLYEEFALQYTDFTPQLIEDKASNAFLQILTANVLRDPAIIRRFVSEQAIKTFKDRIPSEPIAYNRLFINSSTVIGAFKKGDCNYIAVEVKYSAQRVKLMGDKVQLIDAAITSRNQILVLCRKNYMAMTKGLLYMHQCPNCGAPAKDTLSITCPYCQSSLNNIAQEWIVDRILEPDEYWTFCKEHTEEFCERIDTVNLEQIYNLRDYALNNLIIVFAADGVFGEKEKEMALKIAKQWNYAEDVIDSLMTMAQTGRLAIRMPSDPKDCLKIYDLMCKAAQQDGTVSTEEQKILDFVKSEFLVQA